LIRRILVPLDGSPLAESTLPHAAALADAFRAEVCLLRVLEPGRVGGLTADSLEMRLQRREVGAYLEGLATSLRATGATVTVAVNEGRAAEEIVRRVQEDEVDLVIASTWGQGGPSDFGLGGTARKLVAGGHTSIMLIRPLTPPVGGPGKPVQYGRIVVPVDGSRRADWALCLAACIARNQGSELVLVHVVAVPEAPARLPPQPLEDRLRRQLVKLSRTAAEQYLDEMQGLFQGSDLAIRWKVVVAPRVPDALLRTARIERAGLVVMSAHGASDEMPWPYGSVAAGLLSHCDRPLLVFQDRPPARRRPDAVGAERLEANIPAAYDAAR